MNSPATAELCNLLHRILLNHPQGIREYDLYLLLKQQEVSGFANANLHDPLQLYRVNFILWHMLYTLRDQLRAQERADLILHCLEIRLLPWRRGEHHAPAVRDQLREYYLDLTHLEDTTAAEVEALLDQFWVQFNRLDRRSEALATLELATTATPDEIRARFRQLAKEHHPDHGGTAATFRQIKEAFDLLQ